MARERLPVVAGLVVGLAMLLGLAALPEAWRTSLRERGFDLLLTHAPSAHEVPGKPIVFVDIDSESLAAFGPWPWRREHVAALIERITAAEPEAVAVDILFAGEDSRSPAALARRLAAEADQPALAELAKALPDGDARLAEAIAGKPVVLGAVLAEEKGEALLVAPGLDALQGLPRDTWRAIGAIGPPHALAEKARGTAILSLAGDTDGVIRRVPLVALAGQQVVPGLAFDALRVASGEHRYAPTPAPSGMAERGFQGLLALHHATRSTDLRLIPLPAEAKFLRISARDALIGAFDPAMLKGAIVVVGGSAPELGSLRHSLAGPLTPSAEIHARAVWQLQQGRMPVAQPDTALIPAAMTAAMIGLAVLATLFLGPGIGVLLMIAAGVIVTGITLRAAGFDMLIDPIPALSSGFAAFTAASLAAFAQNRVRHQRLSQRFGQHLAPAVVARILAEPDAVKLGGERRVITALFSDIEGFTGMAGRASPEDLIAVLDGYFEGVTAIITRHGGMVDKFVGDAVHAFFNMPLDLDDHATHALRAAEEMIRWTETYRRELLPASLALGRTRIGIESGPAIVGDVGLSTKLDYTAHGAVVNTAARLEGLNKETGTSILVGAVAADMIGRGTLASQGVKHLRGIGEIEVFSV